MIRFREILSKFEYPNFGVFLGLTGFFWVLIACGLFAQTTYYSRASGSWDSPSTWSTVTFDNSTNTGTFPVAGDIALIGGAGYVITVNSTAACATLNIGDNSTLNVNNGFTVSGTTTVGAGSSGMLAITSGSGAKSFVGLVTINTGAIWNEAVNERIDFRGGITNNGTFIDGGGEHRFVTNAQTLTGNFSISRVTMAGVSSVLTNTNNLTINSALLGSGTVVQGANAVLNIGGVSTVNNLVATANGNTVNYSGAGQTVYSIDYQHLTLSGSGVKTLQTGTATIAGNLTLGGTTSTTAVRALTIGGSIIQGVGTTFTAGGFTHIVGGSLINNGTFNGAGTTLNLNGGAQSISGNSITINDLQLTGTGTKTLGSSITVSGILSIDNGVIANLNNVNAYSANSLLLGGAIQGAGSWGSTSSAATNQNNTFFSGTGFVTIASGAATYYSIASAAWNLNTTWSTTGFGGGPAASAPGPSDFVFIGGGRTVTVTSSETCAALSFDAGTNVTNTLTIGSGSSLTVSGAVTIPQTVTSGSNMLNVGAGTFLAGSLDFTASTGGAGHQMSISTGTASISGNITGIGPSSTISMSGNGLLRLGGAIFSASNGTLSSSAGSTVEYNGGVQTVQALGYNNLTLSGGNKTLAATTNLGGNLNVGIGTTLTIGIEGITVSGSTVVNGSLTFSSISGTKTFAGLVTVNGTWTNSFENINLMGGLTSTGTFTAGTGNYTFSANSQVLTGTLSIPNIIVTGIVLTNSNSLTVSSSLSGSGNLLQASNATLNLGGTSSITTLTAVAFGNTVNYTGVGQTIHANNYHHLGLSGSGVKTFQVNTASIAGNLTLSGSVSASAVRALTIGGSLTIGSGTSFTAGPFAHFIGGNWTNSGTFSGTGSTINLNGGSQNVTGNAISIDELQLSGSGTKSLSVGTTVAGNFLVDNGVVASLNNANIYSSNSLSLSGALQAAGTWGSSSSAATNQNDIFFSGTGLLTVASSGLNYYSIASAAWNVNTTWSNSGFGGGPATGTPGPNDIVFVGGGRTVTVVGAETCSALLFDAGTSVTNTLIISSGNSLTVSGTVTIPQTVTSGANVLNVGAGNLSAGSLDFTASAGGAAHRMTISTGTASISGSITGIGASSTINITGAGLLQVGNSIFTSANGTLTTVSGSTVEYNGAAQAIQALPYNNLRMSGSGNKTLVTSTTVGGNLDVGIGTTLIVGALNLTVNGSTTVGGTLSITSNTGTKIFSGLVTVNGTWNNSTESVTLNGGITNNGTFTAGTGTYTFSTNSQTLTGTFSIPRVTVAGGAVVLTNTNNLTVSTALSGSGRLTQASNAVLNIGGSSIITNMTATANGNTVNYTGAGQTINNNNFHHLNLSGSGVKTLQAGTTSVAGNLTLSGSMSTAAVVGISVGGSLSIGAGTSFTAGNFTHNIGGDWINNGTFAAANSTINLNGTSQSISGGSTSFNNLQLSGSGVKTLAATATVGGDLTVDPGSTFSVGAVTLSVNGNSIINGTISITSNTGSKTFIGLVTINGTWTNTTASVSFQGGITNTGSFTAGSGTYTFTTNSQALTGLFTIPFVTVTGGSVVLTNNNSLSVSTSLSGSGQLTQNNNAVLNLGGNSSISNLSATANGNTVNYTGSAQTVHGNDYYNLVLSGSGAKVMQSGTSTIGGDFSLTGTVSTSAVIGLSINGSINIGSGTSFSSGNFTHSIGGNWSNNGTFSASGGTINFNGANQSISGNSDFNNLSINSSGAVTLLSSQNLLGHLSIGPTSSFNAGTGFLTLISSSDTQSASIGEIQSGANFGGSIRVQRFMGVEGAFNRYVSSPVTDALLSDLISNFAIVNNRAQTYNEPAPGMINNGYVNVAPNQTLVSGKGYLVKPTAAFASTNITWDVAGPLTIGSNQKSVNLNPTFTNNGFSDDGWNLLGNPYPSAIVWDGNPANWDIQDIEPIVYVPDIANPEYFMSYDYSTGLGVPGLGTLTGGVISLGQAFWVKAQGPNLNPTLIIHESAKTSLSGEFYRKRIIENIGLSVTLSDKIGKDVSWLMKKPDALNGYDAKYDRSKLVAPALSVSFVADGRKLVNSTVREVNGIDLPIVVYTRDGGEFSLNFEEIGNFTEFEDLFLIDKELGNVHKISSGPYSFTADSGSEMSDRFFLSTKNEVSLKNLPTVNVYPNPVVDLLTISVYAEEQVHTTILDVSGALLMKRSSDRPINNSHTITFDMKDLASGFYLIKTQIGSKLVTTKIVKQ